MVSKSVTRTEICQEFKDLGIILNTEDVINKLVELCWKYNKDANSLTDEWFAFITSSQLDSQPNEESLNKFENDRLTDHNKHKVTPKSSLTTPRTPQNNSRNSIEDVSNLLKAYGTPEILESGHSIKKQKTSTSFVVSKDEFSEDSSQKDQEITFSQSPEITIYNTKSQSGDTIVTFGNSDVDWINASKSSCLVSYYNEDIALKEGYKYMFEKRCMVSTTLNFKIEFMEDVYKQLHDLDDFADLTRISAEEVDIAGQICCEGNGKLNTSSILIEGSHRTSSGNITKLDVSNLPTFSFFPGQISALHAINNGNQNWFVKSVHSISFPPMVDTNLNDAKEKLSFVIAAGPYTTLDSLSYKSLEVLLETVVELKPHVCILIGPFVDCRRKDSEGEFLKLSYEHLFDKCMEMVSACAVRVNTKFVIVSSSNDVHHECIYPTPPFKYKHTENMYFAPDPILMSFDEIVFGITATDILFHLGKEEITYPPGAPDRLGRLTTHLLLQRSFYPLYPPSEGLNVNQENLQKYAQLPVTPHLLILPSDLSAFIKNVNGCCCINPRRLTCGNAGGTFAHVIISPQAKGTSESLIDCISAKVVKI